MMNGKIWMNGKYLNKNEGTINISTGALHYGTSIFEGILCIKIKNRCAIFCLQDHIDRLFESINVLNFKIQYSKEEICNAIINLVKVNRYSSCYIRPIIFKDTSYLDLESKKGRPIVAILCKRFNHNMFLLQMQKEVKVIVSKKTKNLWIDNLTKAKISGKYLNSVIAKKEAREKGFDDAILLNERGIVTEATSANIFFVKDETIKIPTRYNTLSGITQDSVIQIGRDLGYAVVEQDIKVDELYSADEIFLTNTAKGIISVSQVNSKKILDLSQKRITEVLRNKYINIIVGRDSAYQKWLTYF